MAAYQVFVGTPVPTAEVTLLITSAYRNADGYMKGEWFLAASDAHQLLVGQRFYFSQKSFPAGEIELDERFVFQEAFDQANTKYRMVLRTSLMAGDAPYLFTPVEKALELFAHLWVRNLLHNQLREIFHKTECDELREAIRWISELDPYKHTDLFAEL